MTSTTTATPTISPEQLALAQRILASGGETPTMRTAAGSYVEPAIDVHALIAAAQTSMGVKPIEKPGQVEAADPNAISTLVALAAEHKRQADFHAAQRDAITEALKSMVLAAEDSSRESVDDLTVHGATVFTYKPSISRVLNQRAVKQRFPDIPENADLYSETISRRATYK